MTNPKHTDTGRSGDLVERCGICKRPLDDPSDMRSPDCGGDCLRCMAVVAEDPDCMTSYIEALEAKVEELRDLLVRGYVVCDGDDEDAVAFRNETRAALGEKQ